MSHCSHIKVTGQERKGDVSPGPGSDPRRGGEGGFLRLAIKGQAGQPPQQHGVGQETAGRSLGGGQGLKHRCQGLGTGRRAGTGEQAVEDSSEQNRACVYRKEHVGRNPGEQGSIPRRPWVMGPRTDLHPASAP